MSNDEGGNGQSDWSAHYDDSGSLYYYNNVTEESSWEPPPEGFQPASPPTNETTTEGLAWSAVYNDDGEIYYHNTVTDETSWDPPPEGYNPPPDRENDAEGDDAAAEQPVEEQIQPQEPEGKEGNEGDNNDDNDGIIPSPDMNPADDDDDPPRSPIPQETNEDPPENDPSSSGQSYIWSAFYDDSGSIYYYNSVTEESAWEAPEEGFNPPPEAPKWTMYNDGDRVYYYNETTGETQWEKPEDFVPPEEEEAVEAATEPALDPVEQPPTPEPEPRSPSPPVDPAIARLEAAEAALAKPDYVLEPSCMSNIAEVAEAKGAAGAASLLIKNYQGQTAVCGLLAKWTATLQGADAADAIRSTAADVVHRAVKEGFKKDAADAIMDLKKSEVAFLEEMMDSSRWRRLLIELTAQHKDSAVLLYCLKSISKRGHHREIAQRMNQSEHFAVFNAMLLSELSVVGSQAISAGSDISASIAFPDLVKDLCRSCGATSFTYVYSRALLQRLVTMALKDVEDDKEPERFLRAIEKWRAIAEELETFMIDPAVTGSSPFIRKRRIETALTCSDLHQKRQRKAEDGTVEPALLTLLEKHAAGIQPMESVLDRLLPSGLQTDTKGVGELLLKYPIAIRVLLTPLFKTGRAGSATPSMKNKCARLVALATLASDTTQQDDVEEGETKDEIGVQRMISEGSQLCEQLETMISFLVDIDGKALTTSPGQKLYTLALKCPPVGLGAILWAKEFTRGRDYALSASFPTLSPSVLSLVRLVAIKYPFTRLDALEIALTFLGHSNSDISYQKVNSIKECSLRLVLFLLMKGEVVPVLTSLIKRLQGNSDLDASLIRYFVTGALQVVRPPVSPVFVRLFGKLLLSPRVPDAIRTSYVNKEYRKLLSDLLESFGKVRLHNGTQLPAEDSKLVLALQDMYRVKEVAK